MDKDYGFGGWGIVILIALFFLLFAGRGFGGNGSGESAPATQADVQRATDFAALERQNNEGVAATRQGAYDVTSAVKDNAYNILGELRDLQSVTEAGFSSQQKCCCEILRAIDGVTTTPASTHARSRRRSTPRARRPGRSCSSRRTSVCAMSLHRAEPRTTTICSRSTSSASWAGTTRTRPAIRAAAAADTGTP